MHLLFIGLTSVGAYAQDNVTIGVVDNDDLHVVQKILYPKTSRTELHGSVGLMPFDAYLTTPNAQLGIQFHNSETLSFGAVAGGGYGLKTKVYRDLESPGFGVVPYAFRYLTSVLGGVEWAPIYAKASVSGAQVLHYDVYLAGRAGVSVEQSLIPNTAGSDLALAPTLSPAIGTRVWVNDTSTLRFEFRDDVLIERRAITASTHVKQNANVLVGYSIWSAAKK